MANWQSITAAPRSCGPLLLLTGDGNLGGAFIGYQDADDGRWRDANNDIVFPRWFAQIPAFDGHDVKP